MQEVAPKSKPEIYAFKEGYKIQLAKVCLAQQLIPIATNQIGFGKLKLRRMLQEESAENELQVDYLPNFLEPFDFFIKILITRLTENFFINDEQIIYLLILNLKFKY